MQKTKMTTAEFSVAGFQGAAVAAGIRYKNRNDLALILCDQVAAAAGVFTTSLVKAAPVLIDMERIASGQARAILVNSGVANACTGETGMTAALATSRLVSEALGIDDALVQVASTGVIGQQMPVEPFSQAMPELVAGLKADGLADVARAMMTTDAREKMSRRQCVVEGRTVTICGMAKGAGMIMPNMATMLGFVLTDAAISPAVLKQMLIASVEKTFNSITVDGDTSTNDTVLCLASGKAGNPLIENLEGADALAFAMTLGEVLKDLALMIVADGEGATKLVTIRVKGAVDDGEAKRAGMTVANSPLVKTAFFGSDANWGRIIGALGRSGAAFDPYRVDIFFDDILMVENGLGKDKETEKKATAVLKKDHFTVTVDLKNGSGDWTVYTCDFTLDYVKINADYRS